MVSPNAPTRAGDLLIEGVETPIGPQSNDSETSILSVLYVSESLGIGP